MMTGPFSDASFFEVLFRALLSSTFPVIFLGTLALLLFLLFDDKDL